MRITPKNPGQDTATRVRLLPHSFHSSGLDWPVFVSGYSTAKEEEIHAIGKVPDVRTIGLPKYASLRSPLRRVMLLEQWFQDRYMGDEPPTYGLSSDFEHSINPSLPGNTMVVAGKAQVARPVWAPGSRISGNGFHRSVYVGGRGSGGKTREHPFQSFLQKISLSAITRRLDCASDLLSISRYQLRLFLSIST